MSASLLRPGEIGPADTERILRFLNGVADAAALAETVGFSDGPSAGRRVAAELLAARPFRTLDQVLDVTGVGLVRFTEIAVALSAARPPLTPDSLRFLPVSASALWLGQSVSITAQLVGPDGVGVVDRPVTCVASDGIVSARLGLQVQAGTAIRIAPEPGGLLRFTYGPDLKPRLEDAARAALTAELSRLDGAAATPQAAEAGIKALAARYRGQGAGSLQSAVDRLFENHDAPILSRMAPWPIQPVTLLALTHDETGEVERAASLTLELRNWLGPFYVALMEQIDSDALLPEALKHLDGDIEAGRDLSRKIIQATQGYAALERGELGRRLSDSSTGRVVNTFLDSRAQSLEGDAIVNTVRAAGASDAAIASGGFAVFEAIRSVQEVQDTIKPLSKTGGISREEFLGVDQRLAELEDAAVNDDDLSRFGDRLTASFDDRFEVLEQDRVTRNDLDRLRDNLIGDFDAKLEAIDPGAEFDDRFAELDQRLSGLETGAVRRRDLDTLRDGLTADFDEKLKAVAERFVTDTRLREEIDARMQHVVAREEMDERIAAFEADMIDRLRTKANARTIASLRTTISRMDDDQTRLRADLGRLKTRVDTITRRGGTDRG